MKRAFSSTTVRLVVASGSACLALLWGPRLRTAERLRTWTTSGFPRLAEGTLGDGGANTYVAADGSVRLVNLWDLNQDGNLDLVFASTHDYNERLPVYVYWGRKGFSPERRTSLPSDGGKAVAASDLNGDGFPDLIVANSFNGTKTELSSYVYWGSATGFDVANRLELPTQGAEAVAVADCNRDGRPDIVFANSGLTYHVAIDSFQRSFVYWGSRDGYATERRSSLPTAVARDVKIGDLNRDGFLDIVFANEGNADGEAGATVYWGNARGEYDGSGATRLPGERSSGVALADLDGDGFTDIALANAFRLRGRELGMYNIVDTVALDSFVYWGSASGFSPTRRTALPTVGAAAVAIGDLDHDARPDVVFANSAGGAAYVYWNSPTGFQPYRRLALRTLNAAYCAVDDVNGDGYSDLVVANKSDGRSYDTHSYVFLGDAHGIDAARRTELPTAGATGIAVADLDRDGEKEVVFANKMDGTAGRPVDTWIYWGNERGEFSPARRQALPTRGQPNAHITADINADGQVDLYVPEGEQTIYWGGRDGLSAANKSIVSPQFANSGRIADLNRDGYLDVVSSDWSAGGTTASVFWGGPAGFSTANRFVFNLAETRFLTVADFDRNGWADVAFPTTAEQVVIFWNGPGGFANAHATRLPAAAAMSVEAADLDADGWLDLVVANLFDTKAKPGVERSFGGSPAGDTLIYWGSNRGFTESRRTVLPSVGNEDVAVADLDGDGRLDLVLSSYHAGSTRSHPSYVYWNGSGGFDAKRVTMLPTNSASGIAVADFNRDGRRDILFTCHSKDGDHRTDSFLYWGSAEGYSSRRRSGIPGVGPHLLTVADIGNIYDRGDRYDYLSPPFDAGAGAVFETVAWQAETPFRTRVELQVRNAATREGLEHATWSGPDGPASFHVRSGSRLAPGGGRWIQYKATLVSPDAANTPILRSVEINYR